MGFLYLLFAFVPLLHGQTAGQQLCPNKTWDPIQDKMWNRCIYYCQEDPTSPWEKGYFYNFTTCFYTPQKNGTCYDGLCYGELPPGVIVPSSTSPTKGVEIKARQQARPPLSPQLPPQLPQYRLIRNKKEKKKPSKGNTSKTNEPKLMEW
uniref:Putative salivary secreted basic tail protein n=1 Tax=Rhipicephalus microplus TaxID=6941 RepID=A0A6G5A5I0_RHIMP